MLHTVILQMITYKVAADTAYLVVSASDDKVPVQED